MKSGKRLCICVRAWWRSGPLQESQRHHHRPPRNSPPPYHPPPQSHKMSTPQKEEDELKDIQQQGRSSIHHIHASIQRRGGRGGDEEEEGGRITSAALLISTVNSVHIQSLGGHTSTPRFYLWISESKTFASNSPFPSHELIQEPLQELKNFPFPSKPYRVDLRVSGKTGNLWFNSGPLMHNISVY